MHEGIISAFANLVAYKTDHLMSLNLLYNYPKMEAKSLTYFFTAFLSCVNIYQGSRTFISTITPYTRIKLYLYPSPLARCMKTTRAPVSGFENHKMQESVMLTRQETVIMTHSDQNFHSRQIIRVHTCHYCLFLHPDQTTLIHLHKNIGCTDFLASIEAF